jgi:hypothetical protein
VIRVRHGAVGSTGGAVTRPATRRVSDPSPRALPPSMPATPASCAHLRGIGAVVLCPFRSTAAQAPDARDRRGPLDEDLPEAWHALSDTAGACSAEGALDPRVKRRRRGALQPAGCSAWHRPGGRRRGRSFRVADCCHRPPSGRESVTRERDGRVRRARARGRPGRSAHRASRARARPATRAAGASPRRSPRASRQDEATSH